MLGGLVAPDVLAATGALGVVRGTGAPAPAAPVVRDGALGPGFAEVTPSDPRVAVDFAAAVAFGTEAGAADVPAGAAAGAEAGTSNATFGAGDGTTALAGES